MSGVPHYPELKDLVDRYGVIFTIVSDNKPVTVRPTYSKPSSPSKTDPTTERLTFTVAMVDEFCSGFSNALNFKFVIDKTKRTSGKSVNCLYLLDTKSPIRMANRQLVNLLTIQSGGTEFSPLVAEKSSTSEDSVSKLIILYVSTPAAIASRHTAEYIIVGLLAAGMGACAMYILVIRIFNKRMDCISSFLIKAFIQWWYHQPEWCEQIRTTALHLYILFILLFKDHLMPVWIQQSPSIYILLLISVFAAITALQKLQEIQ